ncbi:hypothetical protein RUND412_009395 [Rhizina undulata]
MHYNSILFCAALIGQALYPLVSAAPTRNSNSVKLRPINSYAKRAIVNAGPTKTMLAPITEDHFNRRLGKRGDVAGDHYGRMDPMDRLSMLFGAEQRRRNFYRKHDHGAPDGMRIINMEAFEGFTTSVDCSTAGDGKIGLTFRDKQSFEYAINKWGWINEKEEHQFVMVTNHDGCGADAERVPYLVNRVDYHEQNFTTDLFATETALEKVASNYTIHFGHIEDGPAIPGNSFATSSNSSTTSSTPIAPTAAPSISARDIFKKVSKYCIKNSVECATNIKEKLTIGKCIEHPVDCATNVSDDAEKKIEAAKKTLGDKFKDTQKALDDAGDGTKDSSVNLNLATGTPGKRKSIWPIPAWVARGISLIIPASNVGARCASQVYSPLHEFQHRMGHGAGGILWVRQGKALASCQRQTALFRKLRLHGSTHRPSPRRFQSHDEIQRQARPKHRVPMNFDITLYTVPLGALEVPHIFSFGPKFDFEVGMQATVNKDVDFDFGFEASLPNKAKFHKDLLTKDSAEARVGTRANWIRFHSSSIPAKSTCTSKLAQTLEKGVCGKSDKKSKKTAVKIQSDVNIDLIFYVGTDVMSNPKPDYQNNIYTKKFPLKEQYKTL